VLCVCCVCDCVCGECVCVVLCECVCVCVRAKNSMVGVSSSVVGLVVALIPRARGRRKSAFSSPMQPGKETVHK